MFVQGCCAGFSQSCHHKRNFVVGLGVFLLASFIPLSAHAENTSQQSSLGLHRVSTTFEKKSNSINESLKPSTTGYVLADISSPFGQALYQEVGKLIFVQGPEMKQTVLLKEQRVARGVNFLVLIGADVIVNLYRSQRKLSDTNDVQRIAIAIHARITSLSKK